jgi:hypothetical protein
MVAFEPIPEKVESHYGLRNRGGGCAFLLLSRTDAKLRSRTTCDRSIQLETKVSHPDSGLIQL